MPNEPERSNDAAGWIAYANGLDREGAAALLSRGDRATWQEYQARAYAARRNASAIERGEEPPHLDSGSWEPFLSRYPGPR